MFCAGEIPEIPCLLLRGIGGVPAIITISPVAWEAAPPCRVMAGCSGDQDARLATGGYRRSSSSPSSGRGAEEGPNPLGSAPVSWSRVFDTYMANCRGRIVTGFCLLQTGATVGDFRP